MRERQKLYGPCPKCREDFFLFCEGLRDTTPAKPRRWFGLLPAQPALPERWVVLCGTCGTTYSKPFVPATTEGEG